MKLKHNHWIVFVFIFSLCSCHQKQTSTYVIEGIAMTIPYKIIFDHTLSQEEQILAKNILQQTFSEVNALYNDWNPDSEISKLNRSPANEKIPISIELACFLKKTDDIYHLTHALFDPTIAPLLELWKKHLTSHSIPNAKDLATLAPAVGWDKVHFNDSFFWKDHPLTALDFGGIAKGYCIDLLVERLSVNFKNVYVEWGGEMHTSGLHPEGRPWCIQIKPLDNSLTPRIELFNEAIATSGDYCQFWHISREKELETYFHIIHPKTLTPMTIKEHSIASATVRAPTCMLADALATAAMLLSDPEEAKNWTKEIQEKIPNTQFWLISR